MSGKRFAIVFFLALLLFSQACGKNEPVVGSVPVTVPPVQTPINYSNPTSYNFPPQVPTQWQNPRQPRQPDPRFYPIHNYMQQSPQMAQYWNGHWNQWIEQCNYYGYNPYDFDMFWYSYCPEQWGGTPMQDIYYYYEDYVYCDYCY